MTCSVKKFFLSPFFPPSRALPQTTYLQPRPQPNLQTPFPPCSLLLLPVLLERVAQPPRQLLSRLKSRCLQNLLFIDQKLVRDILAEVIWPPSGLCPVCFHGYLVILKNHCKAVNDNTEPDGDDVAASSSAVHCWTWIHCPLPVLQHHQPRPHLGEVTTLFPSNPKFLLFERMFQFLDIVVDCINLDVCFHRSSWIR